jgi:hypothetical protein
MWHYRIEKTVLNGTHPEITRDSAKSEDTHAPWPDREIAHSAGWSWLRSQGFHYPNHFAVITYPEDETKEEEDNLKFRIKIFSDNLVLKIMGKPVSEQRVIVEKIITELIEDFKK